MFWEFDVPFRGLPTLTPHECRKTHTVGLIDHINLFQSHRRKYRVPSLLKSSRRRLSGSPSISSAILIAATSVSSLCMCSFRQSGCVEISCHTQMASPTRPSLHPHERAPIGCSLDPTSNQYHQHFHQAGQLLNHSTTTRQSNSRDWTNRQRRPEGPPTLPPLSVWRAGSSSHIPSSEPVFASHQTHRQMDLPKPHAGSQPSYMQPLPSYIDHSRRLQRHSGDAHHSVLEHHPIVRSQRHLSHLDDYIYSSPVLGRVPSWAGVDETEGEGDMGTTDAAASPTALRNLPVIVSPKERRPHKCPHEDCQMSFPRPSALRTHLNKHTGDKRTPDQFVLIK